MPSDASGAGQIVLPLLAEWAAHLGFSLAERQLAKFQLYMETLIEWNSRVNLTAITDLEGVQVRHFLDSLTVGSALLEEMGRNGKRPEAPPDGFSLLDIGTGAGFPGVPLKLVWPKLQVTLADSIGKKTAFLDELVKVLGLDGVDIVTARAEDLGQDRRHRGKYNAVTARAVASLPVLCEYCLPCARVGGWMLAPKKGDISLEIKQAKKAAKIVGGGPPRLLPFRLPGDEEDRYVVSIKKEKATPPGYPRRVGLAKSNPLGTE